MGDEDVWLIEIQVQFLKDCGHRGFIGAAFGSEGIVDVAWAEVG